MQLAMMLIAAPITASAFLPVAADPKTRNSISSWPRRLPSGSGMQRPRQHVAIVDGVELAERTHRLAIVLSGFVRQHADRALARMPIAPLVERQPVRQLGDLHHVFLGVDIA